MKYEFGDWLVDPDSNRIRRDREQRHLEPKAIAVLTCLLDHAGRVVSKETLLREVWSDRVVESSAIPRNIAGIRRALGDDSRRPRYIETIPKLGYRTVAPVRPLQPPTVRPTGGARANGSPITLAVLPFDNLSADADLVYFSDGVSEEILQTVSKRTGVKVIGRSSSFQFRHENKAVHEVARELACTHVLDGSVRRSGNRVRVAAQLIDCADQTTVWSDRFEYPLQDVFALQDDVAGAVARALAVTFSELDRAGPIDPTAFDYYLQAKSTSTQWLGACDGDLLEEAITRAPAFARAWATLAVTRAIEAYLERDPARSEPTRQVAMRAANQALKLDPAAASAYAALSIVEPICGRFEARDALIADALHAEPHDAVALFWACRWSWAVGRLREGLGYITRACETEPLWPQGLHQYATMLYLVGRDADANDLWDRLTTRWPDRDYLWVVPLGINAYLGNWDRVNDLAARLAETGLDTERTRRMLPRVERFRCWDLGETERLAQELSEEVEQTGTLRLYLQWACRVGLTDHVYDLLDRASFAHLFTPTGRVHELDFGLHALFAREGDAMYGDPRFVRLCARLGLCDYWARTERWPDFADELTRHYDFRAEVRKHAAG